MATTYDDILSRAAEDMLTDTPEVQPMYVWIVESPEIHLEVFRSRDAAMNCAQYLEYSEVYRMEVR